MHFFNLLKSGPHLSKKLLLFASMKALKIDETTLYFMLKSLFIHKIFKFCDSLGNKLDQKTMVNFKIYNVKGWPVNNYYTHITQYIMN